MKVGIIGRAGAGRSTLFDALTGQQSGAGQRGRTRLGIATVWDARIDRLTALCKPKKTIFAEIALAQPPGALDMPALREMRDLRAFVHVVGAFSGEPLAAAVAEQVAELNAEMVLADMERVDGRLARLSKGPPRPGEKEALERAAPVLEQERPLRLAGEWDEQATRLLDELGLVSHRPILTVVNVAEDQVSGELPAEAQAAIEALGSQSLRLSAALEQEISRLDDATRAEFLAEYGLAAPVSQRFAQACLQLLDQICFFTVGPDEVRAWPIARSTAARRAARTIHSDLEKGFIRAEVIDYETFVKHGSEAKCKAVGVLRVEGKDYLVQDGDIITVRFNL